VFARKVIELNPWITSIEAPIATEPTYPSNEVRIADLLTKTGPHNNIVPILRQGWLEKDSRYFFDMERCPLTLTDFIRNNFKSIPELRDHYFELEGMKLADRGILTMWRILIDVASGLVFVHSLGEVHRDLKPDNGMLGSFR